MGLFRGRRAAAILFGLIGCSAVPCLATAPVVQSVTDSAGYGARVAPGSLASIFGTNLASATVSAADFPLPTGLGGASVSIGSVSAPLLYASPDQINFQVPSSLKSGTASLVVNGPGGTSASFSVTVTSAAPALFQYGTNHAVAQNATTAALNSKSAPAAAGSVVTVYLTGIGAVDNAVDDGSPTPVSPLASATASYTATIGPASATVQFLGLTADFAGLAQANIQVPSLPSGDYPLVLTVGGYVSASAVISVSGSGTAYTSPLQLTGSAAFANSVASSIALYDNIAYVCGASRIVMVNVANAAQPSVLGEFGASVLNGQGDLCAINLSASPPYLVEIFGVSTSTESFAVYSLSNPKSPTLLTVATTSYGHMVDLSFAGNYAFITTSYITYRNSDAQIIAQNGELLAFDFTTPAHPLFLGALQPSTLNLKPYADVVGQSYAYVATSTATGSSTSGTGVLSVIYIVSPAAMYAINQITVSQAAILLSFDISGNTLLAVGNTTGQRNPGKPDFDFTGDLTLTTVDVTNTPMPALISTFTTSLQVNGTFHVAGFNNGVFAIVNNPPATDNFGPSSLMIVDASQPSAIALYPFQTQFGFSGLLTTNNNYLLAPTSLGLSIYLLEL
jgi:uncharacterized protein (TIGR03437 family)